jgi:hypothetical protein
MESTEPERRTGGGNRRFAFSRGAEPTDTPSSLSG